MVGYLIWVLLLLAPARVFAFGFGPVPAPVCVPVSEWMTAIPPAERKGNAVLEASTLALTMMTTRATMTIVQQGYL